MGAIKQKTAEIIHANALDIAKATVNLHYKQNPELEERYGEIGREKCLEDARYHISYLAEAILAASKALFREYVGWAQQMLEARNIPAEDLATNLNCLKEVLAQRLPIENYIYAAKYLNAALTQLTNKISGTTCFLEGEGPLQTTAETYLNLLLQSERRLASKLIMDEVEKGTSVKDLYLHVFQPVQYEIGRLWQLNKITVAQEHYCTAATQLIMSQLYPFIFQEHTNGKTLVATCISGDLHEIGIRMVADFFVMEGWNTVYLGANTPINSIINTLKTQKADLLLLSATMTYHVRAIDELIKSVRKVPELTQVKILVGGYPFNAATNLWKEVGADGFAANAEDALQLSEALLAGKTLGNEE